MSRRERVEDLEDRIEELEEIVDFLLENEDDLLEDEVPFEDDFDTDEEKEEEVCYAALLREAHAARAAQPNFGDTQAFVAGYIARALDERFTSPAEE